MTLRYVQVTQQDLQREFHTARQNAPYLQNLPIPSVLKISRTDLPVIRQALAATRHLLEMYRRKLSDAKIQRKLHRLDKRLHDVASQLDRITKPEK